MTGLRQTPRSAAFHFHIDHQQAPCHSEKPNKIWVFVLRTVRPPSAIDAAAANFSAHRHAPDAAQCSCVRAPDDASHRQESAIPFVIAKKRQSAETFSERTNQRDVSSSLIGAVLAISVGNMLSYIARAS
jgi:hypothetical protein